MIKFDVLNRWSGEVQFTAEIDCAEDAVPHIKLGLAVKWALKKDAYLRDAYLGGADLGGADLGGANLRGAKWTDDIVIQRVPIQIFGLAYPVTILDQHAQIGCQLHSIAAWAAFSDAEIEQIDGQRALEFWRTYKDALLTLARAAGRGEEPAAAEAAE